MFKSNKVNYSISFEVAQSKSEVAQRIKERILENPTRKYPFYVDTVPYSRFVIEEQKISIRSGTRLDHIDIYINDISGGRAILRFERPKSFPMKIFITLFSVFVLAVLIYSELFATKKTEFNMTTLIIDLATGLLAIMAVRLWIYLSEQYERFKVRKCAKLIVRDLTDQ